MDTTKGKCRGACPQFSLSPLPFSKKCTDAATIDRQQQASSLCVLAGFCVSVSFPFDLFSRLLPCMSIEVKGGKRDSLGVAKTGKNVQSYYSLSVFSCLSPIDLKALNTQPWRRREREGCRLLSLALLSPPSHPLSFFNGSSLPPSLPSILPPISPCNTCAREGGRREDKAQFKKTNLIPLGLESSQETTLQCL